MDAVKEECSGVEEEDIGLLIDGRGVSSMMDWACEGVQDGEGVQRWFEGL